MCVINAHEVVVCRGRLIKVNRLIDESQLLQVNSLK